MKKKTTKASDLRRAQYIKDLLKKNPKDQKFCVLGAGHGGLAMAGHLAIKGFNVNLYNRGRNRIKPVIQRKAIKVEGEVKGTGKIELASTNIKECIKGVDVLMVVVPANAHRSIAEACAPYLKENQVVILNPGRTGGALEFYNVLKQKKLKRFPFIARSTNISLCFKSSRTGTCQNIFCQKFCSPSNPSSLLDSWGFKNHQ